MYLWRNMIGSEWDLEVSGSYLLNVTSWKEI